MALEWQNSFMHRIDNPFRLWEEDAFELCGWRNPIARSNYDDRRIEPIEGKLLYIRSNSVQV
jgi:hypothetical protein